MKKMEFPFMNIWSKKKIYRLTLIYTYLTICSMFDYPSLINFKCGFKYLFFVF
ncbi:087R [Invertebrate iridescent virus Kaz2018]|nr:087R [Invertebrate iridescent virus Kaz2018]